MPLTRYDRHNFFDVFTRRQYYRLCLCFFCLHTPFQIDSDSQLSDGSSILPNGQTIMYY